MVQFSKYFHFVLFSQVLYLVQLFSKSAKYYRRPFQVGVSPIDITLILLLLNYDTTIS